MVLGKVMNEWQCLLCGATFDGVLHTKPEKCPECGGPENEIAPTEFKEEVNDRKENEHDFDYLC